MLSCYFRNTRNTAIQTHDNQMLLQVEGQETDFCFEQLADFICFMYRACETRLTMAYRKFGTPLIDNRQYWKCRRKLYKQYYVKCILKE